MSTDNYPLTVKFMTSEEAKAAGIGAHTNWASEKLDELAKEPRRAVNCWATDPAKLLVEGFGRWDAVFVKEYLNKPVEMVDEFWNKYLD